MGTEGLVGIATGVVAGSIALTGFGLNAFVEGFASLVIVWRFSGSRLHSEKAETHAQRIVALQFFVLAAYVTYEALSRLLHADRPGTSWIGIALVTTSGSECRCSAEPSGASRTSWAPALHTVTCSPPVLTG